MPDPLTLSVLGGAALTEGIKFLYGQATELLKRRRERKDAKAELPAETPALEGELRQPLQVDPAALERLEPDLRELRRGLQDYVDELEPVDSSDERLLETADAVRQILEAVYGQRITFRGEQRPASGPLAEGRVDVGTVSGYVAGVRAKTATGTVRGMVNVNEVTSGGEVVGVDIDHLGEK
nr:hypothetical protein [Kibdelosporangium sp. MJ126-NF4]CEL20764.1 hypothetical protein [Kibdelosporangium sp. MJ126-NF4]CTQ89677.1 hypothetical protein [Kibdelosporangium sp. MJ126-NF4]